MPGEDRTPLNNLPVTFVEGDVLDSSSLQKALEDIENVYHLAGMISILPGKNELLRSVNILGTRNILFACRQANVRRLVYTSSIHALQRMPRGNIINEQVPFDPNNALSDYDSSKARASLDVQQAVAQGLDAIIACPTGVIGPYDFRRSELGQLILDCLKKKPQLYIEGAYDFVDVRDVAQGLILSGEKGQAGETYILSGEKVSVKRLIDTVRKTSGRQFPRLKVPFIIARFASRFSPLYYRLTHLRPRFTTYSLDTLVSNADISHAKAKKELGYSPRPMIESIQDTIAWFLENRQLFLER
jgi:dihydroflavonol-4-reductase